jgi:hypothetical protein
MIIMLRVDGQSGFRPALERRYFVLSLLMHGAQAADP